MCSYCGCDAEPVMAELMEEHESIGVLVVLARKALSRGYREEAVTACGMLAERFEAHARKEERGMFLEMRADPAWAETLAELDADHLALRAGLAAAAHGDLTGVQATLALLMRHADREDTDVFPAALQLLPNQAWSRVAAAHRAPAPAGVPGAGTPAAAGRLSAWLAG